MSDTDTQLPPAPVPTYADLPAMADRVARQASYDMAVTSDNVAHVCAELARTLAVIRQCAYVIASIVVAGVILAVLIGSTSL